MVNKFDSGHIVGKSIGRIRMRFVCLGNVCEVDRILCAVLREISFRFSFHGERGT